jgi:hypothetical protein
MAEKNLLLCLAGLSEEEWGYLAYTVRRYWRRHKQDHYLLKYDHYLEVPKGDLFYEICLMKRTFLITQLRELEAQGGPFPVDAIRDLARKLHPDDHATIVSTPTRLT